MSETEKKEATRQIESFGIEESAGFKNLIAIRDFTVETRKMVQVHAKEVQELKNTIATLNEHIALIRTQIGLLQAKVLRGQSTS